MTTDNHAARELELYIENDSVLYRQQHEPILKNLATKMVTGKYDKVKSIKLWMYLVDAGAKKYAKDFGGTWNTMFSVATRKKVAESLNEAFLTEYSHGSYCSLLPKKYQK